jgi:hypothetical protein
MARAAGRTSSRNGEGRNRTGDTTVFSRAECREAKPDASVLAVFGVLADVCGLGVLANKLTIAHQVEILWVPATLCLTSPQGIRRGDEPPREAGLAPP